MNNSEDVLGDVADKVVKLSRLSYVIRYATVPKLHNETVAEHSFYVASIVIMLHKHYTFNLEAALTMAVMHDWAESFTGDTIHPVRRAWPQLDSLIKEAEFETMLKEFGFWEARVVDEYEKLSTTEAKIVYLADIMQCALYTDHQYSMAPNEHMGSISLAAKAKTETLIKEMEYARR